MHAASCILQGQVADPEGTREWQAAQDFRTPFMLVSGRNALGTLMVTDSSRATKAILLFLPQVLTCGAVTGSSVAMAFGGLLVPSKQVRYDLLML
jgi:hypothetical protein